MVGDYDVKLPNKRVYYLDEAAVFLNCKVSDLIHYGATGRLKISAKLNIPFGKKMVSATTDVIGCGYEGYFQISATDLSFLDENREAADFAVHSFYPRIDDLIYWNDRLKAPIEKEEWGGEFYFENGEPIVVERSKLIISYDDLQLFIKNCLPDNPPSVARKDRGSPAREGGRGKEPLTEAIEYLYLKFLHEGNTEVLKPKNVQEFLRRLREFSSESNRNADEYILERIKEVKINRAGHCSITTHERQIESRHIIKTIPSNAYRQGDVAKRLSKLRREYPLPT